MTVIESLYQYFADCPLLADNRRLNVDFLPADKREYSIGIIPTTPIAKRYLDGSTVRQQLYTFGSSEYCDQTALQNLANSGFYERFADWIERQNRKRIYPDLGTGIQVQKMECLTTGYLHSRDESGNAKYQIQCRLTYYKERDKNET